MSLANAAKRAKTPREAQVRHVMNVRDAAAYLAISADTLYRYASEGTVPSFRLGNRYRFRKALLDEWMDRQTGLQPEKGRAQR